MHKKIKSFLLALTFFALVAWAPVTTPVISGTWVTLCQETVSTFQNVGFKVKNTGANPFTDCQVQVYVGPTTSDWKTYYTWTKCKTLAAGGMATLEFAGNSNEQIRVQAKSTAGTSAYCRPYGN